MSSVVPAPRQASLGSLPGELEGVVAQQPPCCGLACRWPSPRVLVVALSGDLDPLGAHSVGRALNEQLSRSRPYRVVVDLSGLIGVSSEGIELLVDLHRCARIEGFVLLLAGLINHAVQRSLRLAGALPLFTTRSDVEHALAGVTEPG